MPAKASRELRPSRFHCHPAFGGQDGWWLISSGWQSSGKPLETSRLLGHNASYQVLFDHYCALATRAQAEACFAICPPPTAAKIVSFA